MATSQNKEKFEDYEGFIEKFKPKKTTDDCYTPPLVYEAIADWVANEYKLDKRTSPTLYKAVDEANTANTAALRKRVPKYSYPLELVTTVAIYPYARYGIEFVVPRSASVRVSALDSQRAAKKAVFGCGWLVSEQVRAEREKAERWHLSERELEIIARISNE